MSQQRSLFSFYSRGAPAGNPKESSEVSSNGVSPRIASSKLFNHQLETPTFASGSRVQEQIPTQDVLQKIQKKFLKKVVNHDDKSPLVQEVVRTEEDDHLKDNSPFLKEFIRKERLVYHSGDAPVLQKIARKENSVQHHEERLDLGNDVCIVGFKRNREVEMTKVPDHEKRTKLLEALGTDNCSLKSSAWEIAKAKFEWMTPARIRDAKGRRPGEPLYDARTIHIPEDVFRKLSASQKQYWATKCQYMDTLLFFKVGKFYELYELDAEIGHKELDWKLIVSGVGKCRQVGCPESGIEDAVQKLVSRGYKVGRMEQIETSAQARANGGPNVTVQRELTQVRTPSTMVEGNIGPEAVHLLALKEKICNVSDQERSQTVVIGFAFVDAAVGRFYVGSIQDDCSRSALLTLLTQVAPQELLYENGGISDETRRVLRCSSRPGLLPLALTPLEPNSEFMEAGDVIVMLRSRHYFKDDCGTDWCAKGLDPWPTALESMAERDLATSALGALYCHLNRMKCDCELLPNGVLYSYEVYKGSLRLDGQTVDNLELLQNRANGGKAGTLLSYLDSCVTQFGKRLLRRWICHPLQNIKDIEYRLDAVDELRSSEVSATIRAGLRKLPDLERLTARLRGLAASPKLGLVPMAAGKVHQRRLNTLSSTILGIRAACDLFLSLKNFSCGNKPLRAKLLQSASTLADAEALQTCLGELELCIDQSSKSPRLVCELQNSEDDDELEAEAGTLTNLINHFNEQGSHWKRIVEALGELDVLISFAAAVNASTGANCRPQFVSRHELKGKGPVLDIKGLWHPYATGGQGGAFVPNDVELGDVSGSMIKPFALLLTGPNMGGKSTLLRATCLAVIMAQLGCFVPCESCAISPVDTIFTRLGASDRIMMGQSTFMVECSETASVLRHATSDSLVVLDELGRGTSTFDGYAIAYAVFHRLVNTVQCRLMFATHYHPLTEEFSNNPSVRLGHLACSFELYKESLSTCANEESALEKQLVFLYKLTEGACPKSYGLQAALLAGIPKSVVRSAESASGIIQKRLAGTFDQQKRLVRAVMSAAKIMPTGIRRDIVDNFSFRYLQALWRELRENEKFVGELLA